MDPEIQIVDLFNGRYKVRSFETKDNIWFSYDDALEQAKSELDSPDPEEETAIDYYIKRLPERYKQCYYGELFISFTGMEILVQIVEAVDQIEEYINQL